VAISTVVFDKFSFNKLGYSIGFPIDFYWVMDTVEPQNFLYFLNYNNFVKIHFRVDLYLLCVLIYFFVFKVILNAYKNLRNRGDRIDK